MAVFIMVNNETLASVFSPSFMIIRLHITCCLEIVFKVLLFICKLGLLVTLCSCFGVEVGGALDGYAMKITEERVAHHGYGSWNLVLLHLDCFLYVIVR